MYVTLSTLASVFGVITALHETTTFDKYNQGITDMTIFINLIPLNTTKIKFNENSISHVNRSVFQNLPYLNVIKLEKNLVSSIDDWAFSGTPTLTTIGLTNNKLQVIRRRMFSGLPKLNFLFLMKNQISMIEDESFKV